MQFFKGEGSVGRKIDEPKFYTGGTEEWKESIKSEDYHVKCEDHKTYKLNNRLNSLILLSLWWGLASEVWGLETVTLIYLFYMLYTGLEYLASVDCFLIHQQISLLEAFTGFEDGNKYEIKNALGQRVYLAVESELNISQSNWMGQFD